MTLNICPNCHVGRLQHRTLVYVQWHGEDLLVVDRMPAVVCDMCGERMYDDRAVEQLQQLLWTSLPGVDSSRSHHLA